MNTETEAAHGPRVLVVGNDSLARAGLMSLVSGLSEVRIAGQASGREDTAPTLDAFNPDVAVWDLGWSDEIAFERIAEYHDAGITVVALASEDEEASRARAAGAVGVLSRDIDADGLQAALSAVSYGMVVLDPRFSSAVPYTAARQPSAATVETLTRRELEVLRLLAEGSSNKAAAYQLDISEHTVKFHVNSIFTKLNAQSRTEAVTTATRLGLILL